MQDGQWAFRSAMGPFHWQPHDLLARWRTHCIGNESSSEDWEGAAVSGAGMVKKWGEGRFWRVDCRALAGCGGCFEGEGAVSGVVKGLKPFLERFGSKRRPFWAVVHVADNAVPVESVFNAGIPAGVPKAWQHVGCEECLAEVLSACEEIAESFGGFAGLVAIGLGPDVVDDAERGGAGILKHVGHVIAGFFELGADVRPVDEGDGGWAGVETAVPCG